MTSDRLDLLRGAMSRQDDEEGGVGLTPSLVLISGVCLAWWATSIVLGPLWLARLRHDPRAAHDLWVRGLGDECY